MRMRAFAVRRIPEGYSLLELCTTIAVICIIATLLVPAYEVVRMRLDKASCMNNLRELYVGGNAYLQEYEHWPQVNPALLEGGNSSTYDEAWIEALLPFGVNRINWICPTVERDLGGPDYTQPANYRTDYVAMPFDSKNYTPYRWPFYPWFVERGNVHGNGNLMILANGAVTELGESQYAAETNSPNQH